jgi:hypothetical protein
MAQRGQIKIFPSVKATGSRFAQFEVVPGAVRKKPVRNKPLLRKLQEVLPGQWRKVYKLGVDGRELHYFEHPSGAVALPKIKWGSIFR